MATKIQVTITQDKEHGGTDAGMLEAFHTLLGCGVLPTSGLQLTIECGDQHRESIRDMLAVALTDRPIGIDVKIKSTISEEIERRRMVAVASVPTRSPMERVWDDGSGSVLETAAEEWNRRHPESPARVVRS